MEFNHFGFFRNGYHQGLIAVASFIESGKTFEQWYGVEPNNLDNGWSRVLKALHRENEYYDLKSKFEEKDENRI